MLFQKSNNMSNCVQKNRKSKQTESTPNAMKLTVGKQRFFQVVSNSSSKDKLAIQLHIVVEVFPNF